MIPCLAPNQPFPQPHPHPNRPENLICVSQTISPTQILAAYQLGIFPWYEDEDFVYWFIISPRAVLRPDDLYISRSLGKALKNQHYRVAVNQNFATVVAACAHIPRAHQAGSWISPRFQAAYTALHKMGHAHSFEYYNQNNELTGGLYGVQIGSVFFGESMFALESNASKIAFAHAVPFLARCGVQLIDCQQDTPHLRSLGSHLMAFDDFQAALREHTASPLFQTIKTNYIITTG